MVAAARRRLVSSANPDRVELSHQTLERLDPALDPSAGLSP
jgi:hypothetical protein